MEAAHWEHLDMSIRTVVAKDATIVRLVHLKIPHDIPRRPVPSVPGERRLRGKVPVTNSCAVSARTKAAKPGTRVNVQSIKRKEQIGNVRQSGTAMREAMNVSTSATATIKNVTMVSNPRLSQTSLSFFIQHFNFIQMLESRILKRLLCK